MATNLPVPVAAETPEPVEGEVIVPTDVLRFHEANIRKNWKKALGGIQSIGRSLNVIYYNDLWKLHLTGEGKRRYTNFNDYLTAEFGWDKTPARARQIMKSDLPAAIEAGEVPETSGQTNRQRSAPEIDVLKACQVSHKQLTTVAEAFDNRRTNVTDSDELLAEFQTVADTVAESIQTALDALEDLSTRIIEAEAEAEEADDEDDDETDEAESE